jgi:hypothetical protein
MHDDFETAAHGVASLAGDIDGAHHRALDIRVDAVQRRV